MDGPPAASANSSIMRRAQKIRQRMMLEMASGVPVTTRDGFLRVCLQYERDASDGSLPACDRVYGGSCDMEDILQSSISPRTPCPKPVTNHRRHRDRVYGGSCDMEDILQSSSCWNWQR